MSLRFIYGRAGCGKSHYCLNDIKNRIAAGEGMPLILLVPEQFSFQSEKNLLETLGEENILKAEVLSFRRMAYRVFNEVGGMTKTHMDASGRAILIYRIMEEVKGNLKFFLKASKQSGFVDIISNLITEMKRYNITPDILLEKRESIDDGVLKNKVEDIAVIYDSFERRLHEKYIDAEDDLTILSKKLPLSNIFNASEIWIDEFSSFTPQEYTIIEELLKKTSRINVCLCTDKLGVEKGEDIDIFSPVKATQLKLLKLAADNGIKVEPPIDLNSNRENRFKNSLELSHLEKNIFSYPYKPYGEATKDLSIFKAVNKYSEVEETARDIIRIVRDRGVRYRDIAVVTGNLDGYESLVRAIFDEYEIPYFIDKKREIENNPLVMLITSSLEIYTRNWSYEPVFRYLKTGLLDIEMNDIDILENYVLVKGIKGVRWQEEDWDYRFNFGFDGEMSDYERSIIERVNVVKKKITLPLSTLHIKMEKAKNALDMSRALFEFLFDTGIYEKIKGLSEDFKCSGDLELSGEYSQVWNMIMKVLDQIVEVAGEEKLTIEEFLKVFLAGIGQYEIGLIPPSLDQTLVGSVERLKSHDISYLYIIGVNDGIFPKSPKDEGILNDCDREKLGQLGIELSSGIKSKVFEEQFLTYSTITTAGRYLRISYAIADHEGKSMRPSILIPRIKRIFPKIMEDSNIINRDTEEENIRLVTLPKSTFREYIGFARREYDGIDVNEIWRDVKEWYMAREDWRDKCGRVLSGLTYTNQVKVKNPKKIRRLYGKEMYLSVSRIEKYAQCPFSYFVQYGLRAKERRTFEMNAPDIGSFMHEVIDRFSKALEDEEMIWRDIEREWCIKKVSDIVDEIVKEKEDSIFSSSKRYKYLTERFKRILTRAIWLIATHIKRSGFEPLGYEVSFGAGGEFPPINIELSSGERISLIGRIDRIDKMETEEGTYLRVVDYKSGNKAFNLSDVYSGLEIQLLVYLDAMLSMKGDKKVLPAGVLYFKVDDPIIKSNGEILDESIEMEIMKKLKMKGLLLADTRIIKEMDREIDGNSNIIPARINADGSLGKSSAATLEEFQHLRSYVRGKLQELCEEMVEGNIRIEPYKKKNETPCGFCKFSSICHFDSSIKDNKYKLIKDMKDEEIWSLIAKNDNEEGKNLE